MTTGALPLPCPRWRHLLWRHPETWVFLLSAAAWCICIAPGELNLGLIPHVAHAFYGHAGHSAGHLLDACGAFHWSIMIVAMMFPTLVGQLRVVSARSLWFRRNRAIAFLLAGYSCLWLLYGFVLDAGFELLRTTAPIVLTFLAPFFFLVAVLWQLTPQKRQSLIACHITMPLAPSGWRADFDCYQYGFRIGTSCCLSCWALMLACAATGHTLWAMVIVALISWSERFVRRPSQLWFSLALCTAGLVASLVRNS
jgi:hypothetical protein